MSNRSDVTAPERCEAPPSIADIIITSELWARPARPADLEAERAAIRRLADTMATDPAQIFQLSVELALELCRADTSGISVQERTDAGEEVFRWIAIAGQLQAHLHGTTPRHFSPCGIAVDTGEPLLMRRPELVYTYLDVGPSFHDALLIPLGGKGSCLEATIWIIAHNSSRKFDGEDARLMQRIAMFTATALQMAQVVEHARAEAARQKLAYQELDHRVKNTLQMTASLLRLQLGSVPDPAARAAIESASQRVLALGQIHRIGAGGARGDLAKVVESVCADLFATTEARLRLDLAAERMTAPAPEAALVALIVNELATNAIKHGFRGRAAGTVTIGLRRVGPDAIAVSVADDGVPLPAGVKEGQVQGLGLSLVRQLADQLAGKLIVDAEPKRLTVVFQAPQLAPDPPSG